MKEPRNIQDQRVTLGVRFVCLIRSGSERWGKGRTVLIAAPLAYIESMLLGSTNQKRNCADSALGLVCTSDCRRDQHCTAVSFPAFDTSLAGQGFPCASQDWVRPRRRAGPEERRRESRLHEP